VESGGASVGKVGKCDMESWYLQGCNPRLCRLRTDGLAPISKYWMYWSHAVVMGPISRLAGHQQMICFTPSASSAGRGEKWCDTHELLSQARGCIGSTCSSEVEDLSNSVDDYAKSCHVRGLLARSIRVAYMDWRGKRTCRFDQVPPIGCTSIQIAATHGYE
jgi:hypothetical protein